MDEFPSIRDILSGDVSSWLVSQLENFPSISKFRARNSVQFLMWASTNEEAGMKIPALFCALHAEEEAIASFVSALKATECGGDAKAINLHCHRHKSVVRILCHQIMKLVD